MPRPITIKHTIEDETDNETEEAIWDIEEALEAICEKVLKTTRYEISVPSSDKRHLIYDICFEGKYSRFENIYGMGDGLGGYIDDEERIAELKRKAITNELVKFLRKNKIRYMVTSSKSEVDVQYNSRSFRGGDRLSDVFITIEFKKAGV